MTTFTSPFLKPPPAYVASERTRRRIAGELIYEWEPAPEPAAVEVPQPAPRPIPQPAMREDPRRKCGHCGDLFFPINSGHRYCTHDCKYQAHLARLRAESGKVGGAAGVIVTIPARKMKRILEIICKVYEVTVADVMCKSRATRYAAPRLACYLALREIAGASYPQIGRVIGGRDHTTAVCGTESARKRLRSMAARDMEWAARYRRAERLCRAAVTP